MAASGDDDPTLKLSRPSLPGRPEPGRTAAARRGRVIAAAAAAVVVLSIAGVALLLRSGARQTPRIETAAVTPARPEPARSIAVPLSAAPVAVEQGPLITLADEATIVADNPVALTVFRFAPNPSIVVLDFPTLREQAQMLNRIAIFVEKAGAPHDHVLDDQAVETLIRAGGETAETFYYGHDYRSGDIARFFHSADEDHVGLTQGEQWLRRLATRLGWFDAGAPAALISLPRAGADSFVDATVRAVILHHELSHGEYFTQPPYAAYSKWFFANVMTASDRGAFTSFLARQHYDTGIEDLIVNETQAYLMHTGDARFVSPQVLGIGQGRYDLLRAAFLLGMPPGWLRDCTAAPLAVVPARAPRRRRRRYFLGTMSSRKAVAATRPSRLRAASIAA